MSARSRSGPGSPARMARVVAAFCSGVPPTTASGGLVARPTSPGATVYARTPSPSTSTTRVAPDVLISSSPSSLDTTNARSTPSLTRAPAIRSSIPGSLTPISWRRAPAGLVSGPRKLKIVRTASSFRTGTTKRVAAWCAGANMKPKPASRMHAATASGPRSTRAPSASSRSALPLSDVALRLPCLATAQPAPAAMIAAVVETLNVGRPPPVPAVSSRSSRPHSTRAASARIVRASPASSSSVSPLARRAMRKPAICTSLASPAMMTSSTAAAWSLDRSRPDATASMACVRIASGIHEVAQQRAALVGEHRLGVELHALGRQLAVADGHDDPSPAGGDLECVGQRLLVHDERVIPAHGQWRGNVREDRAPVVLDRRRLAVHRQVADDGAAEGLRERLVAQADAE